MRFSISFALPLACAFFLGCGSSSDSGTPSSDDSGTGVDSTTSDTGTIKTDSGTKVDSSTTDSTSTDSATSDSSIADSGVAETSTIDSAVADSSTTDSATTDTAVADTAVADTAPGTDAGATVTLKVEDYASWCSVQVNGGTADTTLVQTYTVPAGSTVNLSGDTASDTLFVWGYWRGTDPDPGHSPYDTAQVTTVTMTGDKTIQACCPLKSSPTTSCPAPTP